MIEQVNKALKQLRVLEEELYWLQQEQAEQARKQWVLAAMILTVAAAQVWLIWHLL